MYSLEHLRMLVVTVDTGSFSACARKLGKVQSAVSQGIAALEDDLNIVLFDRSTRKPTLTTEGARILAFARSILLQVDDLETAANAIHDGEEALVRLAIDKALSLPKIHDILGDFEARFPTTGIALISTASPDIGRIVKNGRADIGIIFSEVDLDKELDHCFIGNLPFYAVCSHSHPLGNLEHVHSMDLLQHRQIMLQGEIGGGLDLFPKMSTLVWHANDFHTISTMVIAGFGWAYVPAHFIDDPAFSGRLRRLNFSFDYRAWSPPVELITSKNTLSGPAARWLHDSLKRLLEGMV